MNKSNTQLVKNGIFSFDVFVSELKKHFGEINVKSDEITKNIMLRPCWLEGFENGNKCDVQMMLSALDNFLLKSDKDFKLIFTLEYLSELPFCIIYFKSPSINWDNLHHIPKYKLMTFKLCNINLVHSLFF